MLDAFSDVGLQKSMIAEVWGCHTRAEWLLLFLWCADNDVRWSSTPYTQADVCSVNVLYIREAKPLCCLLIRMLYLSCIATPLKPGLALSPHESVKVRTSHEIPGIMHCTTTSESEPSSLTYTTSSYRTGRTFDLAGSQGTHAGPVTLERPCLHTSNWMGVTTILRYQTKQPSHIEPLRLPRAIIPWAR